MITDILMEVEDSICRIIKSWRPLFVISKGGKWK